MRSGPKVDLGASRGGDRPSSQTYRGYLPDPQRQLQPVPEKQNIGQGNQRAGTIDILKKDGRPPAPKQYVLYEVSSRGSHAMEQPCIDLGGTRRSSGLLSNRRSVRYLERTSCGD